MNYVGHLAVGIIAFFVLWHFFPLNAGLFVPAIVVCLFYSLFPDIDTDVSKINDFVEILLLFGVLYCLFRIALGEQVFLNYGVVLIAILIFIKFLKHRGWMHSIQAGVLLSAPLYFFEPALIAFSLAGYLSHLIVDKTL